MSSNKSVFYMLVGLPASGKSEYAKKLSVSNNCIIHSSDSLRKELFDDIDCQNRNEELFQELHRRIIFDLSKGYNVIYDACNISYKRRMQFLKMINFINCDKICVLLATPYKNCVNRDKMRENMVGEEVIKRMYKNLYIPQLYENFSDIKIIWNYDRADFSIWELFNGENGLNKIEQDTPYHTLTIGEHCSKCFNELLDLSTGLSYELYTSALLHDIGKAFCKEFNEEKGHCTYYQHHLVSSYNSLFYLHSKEISVESMLEIANYIQWHMYLFSIKSDKTRDKFIKLVGYRMYENLVLLHEADKMAK